MRIAALALVFLALACSREQAPPAPSGVDVVEAPASGDIAKWVRDQQLRAAREKRTLVVYASASWCEPCRYFQDAVKRRELDKDFPGLRLLKFDFDRDEGRLADAGYVTDMIPLFVVPEPSGRGGDRRLQGAIKGAGAVAYLRSRLRDLLQN